MFAIQMPKRELLGISIIRETNKCTVFDAQVAFKICESVLSHFKPTSC